MAELFSLLLEKDILSITLTLGIIIIVLAVIGRLGTYVDLPKGRQVILGLFGVSLLLFSIVGFRSSLAPSGPDEQATLQVPQSNAPTPSSLTETPSASGQGDAATTTDADRGDNSPGIITVAWVTVFAFVVSVFNPVIFPIWTSYPVLELRRKYFGFDAASWCYSRARDRAIRAATAQAEKANYLNGALHNLQLAIRFDKSLFEKAEKDLGFEELRKSLKYRLFVEDMHEPT